MISPPQLSLEDVQFMTPLKSTVIGLVDECGRTEPRIREITHLIESDPVFAARLLAMANSPLFGCTREIASIDRAVVVLGLKVISELAIVAGTEQTIKNTLGDERMKQDLFNHLLGCGIVARRLAKTESTIDPGEAFLGGLLHDIGKLLLLSADIHMEQSIAPRATTERQLRTEREHYGVEHQELGQRYAELMGLPSSISRAIGNHHAPSDADGLQSTIYRANRLSRLWTIGSPADPDTADASNLDFELHGDTDAMGDAVLTEYRLLKEAMAN